MSARIFVPTIPRLLSVGPDAVAAALSREARNRGVDVAIVRTGSRGLFWLEPLVEVETAAGRKGYGSVSVEDVRSLFECGFLSGGAHPKSLGALEDIPYLKRQQRLVFARCGLTDPLSLDDYRRQGGLMGLEGRWNSDPTRPSTRVWPRTSRTRRRRLPDRDQMADRRVAASDSKCVSATQTKATAARSPAVC